jgi:hypothetical protein
MNALPCDQEYVKPGVPPAGVAVAVPLQALAQSTLVAVRLTLSVGGDVIVIVPVVSQPLTSVTV